MLPKAKVPRGEVKGKAAKVKKAAQKKQREFKHKAKAAKVKGKKKRVKKDKRAPHKAANLGACRVMADSFTGLRVGTDFSGCDTPIMSLRALSNTASARIQLST